MEYMIIDDENRAQVAQWCGGQIVRDNRPGLILHTQLGEIRAMPGDIIFKFVLGYVVYTPKFHL
jgi:hypothetical protein